VSGRAFVC